MLMLLFHNLIDQKIKTFWCLLRMFSQSQEEVQLLQEELIELKGAGLLSESNLFELEPPNKPFHSFVQTPSLKLESDMGTPHN